MDTMKAIVTGLKEMKDTAVKCRNEQPLAAYIAAKLPLLEMACEIRIPDMQELREKTAGNNPVSPETSWAGRIGYSLPAKTAFIILPEEYLSSGFRPERGCLVGELTKGLLFVSGFKKLGNSGLWMPEPYDCEFLVSPGKSTSSFQKTLMQRFENVSNMQSLLNVWGEGSILPWPIRNQNLVETAQRLETASDLLGDLHSVLMAGGNGEWVFAETQDSQKGKRIYELKKMANGTAAGGEAEYSELARELNKAIRDLGTCTICSNPKVSGGGMLTLNEQPGGYVYALCKKCMEIDNSEKITLLERKISSQQRMPIISASNLVQGNSTVN